MWGKPLSGFHTMGYFGPTFLKFSIKKIVHKQLKIMALATVVASALSAK